MKRQFSVNFELLAYAGAFLLAAGLRLAGPTWPLLTDDQAAQALAAAAASRIPIALPVPQAISAAVNPLYHAWTSLLFQIAGLSDAAARLVGVLAGTGLVLIPWFLRPVLGRWPSVFGAWLLAVAPILITSSRAPDGGMTALLVIGLGLAGYLTWPQTAWANLALGVCLGLTAAAGPEAAAGLAGVGLGSLLYLALRKRVLDPLPRPAGRDWRMVGAAGVGAFLLASTALGLVPSALPAALGAAGAWLAGWASVPQVSGLTLLAALAIYQPLWVVLGIAGMLSASARRSAAGGWLTCWTLGGLAVAIIYPGRSLQLMIWPTAAISVLGGLALADLTIELRQRAGWASRLGLGLAMLLVLGFGGLQLMSYAEGSLAASTPLLGPAQQLFLAAAALLLAAFMAVLIGLGWSWREAVVVSGSVAITLTALLGVAATWRLNYSGWAGTGQELANRTTSTLGQRLLAESIDTLAGARRESADPVTLQVYGELPPSMAWSLRRAPVEWLPNGATEAAGIVLMPEQEYDLRSASLRDEYRGQSLATRASWGWSGVLPPGLLNWYFRAVAPVNLERWVLLVRSDLVVPDVLPGGDVQP